VGEKSHMRSCQEPNERLKMGVRGSVIDVRFDKRLPLMQTQFRAGWEVANSAIGPNAFHGAIAIKVLTQFDARHVRCIAQDGMLREFGFTVDNEVLRALRLRATQRRDRVHGLYEARRGGA